jgi:charged multivesicular body protein 3
MDEMMEDVLAVEDDEEIEAEADAEVDKVLYDLTDGKLGQAGAARTELPASPMCLTTTRYADLA